jgi:transketolase
MVRRTDPAYRDTILPSGGPARVSVEAGITGGRERIIGNADRSVSTEHYGAYPDHQTLYRQFGITADATAAALAFSAPSTAPSACNADRRCRGGPPSTPKITPRRCRS